MEGDVGLTSVVLAVVFISVTIPTPVDIVDTSGPTVEVTMGNVELGVTGASVDGLAVEEVRYDVVVTSVVPVVLLSAAGK